MTANKAPEYRTKCTWGRLIPASRDTRGKIYLADAAFAWRIESGLWS